MTQAARAAALNDSISEPMTSDSDSVYSHVASNYLESQQSLEVEMRLERDNYHIKQDKSSMRAIPDNDTKSKEKVVIPQVQAPGTFVTRLPPKRPSLSSSWIKTGLNSYKPQ